MTQIAWDKTIDLPSIYRVWSTRSAELCEMGGSVIDLLDRAEDHRRGALDRPADQMPGAESPRRPAGVP